MTYKTVQTKAGTIDALAEQPAMMDAIIYWLNQGDNSKAAENLDCMIDVLKIELEMIRNNWAGAPIADAEYTQKLKDLGEE